MAAVAPSTMRPLIRLLTAEEEASLVGRWCATRDQAALDRIITAHRPLALKIALRYRSYGLPLADLIQEGHIGLLEAAHRFDPAKEVRFATYAQWWIKSTIQDYVLRNAGAVRTVTSSRQKALMFTLRRLQANNDPLTPEARLGLAKRHKMSLAAVDGLAQRLAARDQSLDAPLTPGGLLKLVDTLADDRLNPEEAALAGDEAEFRHRALARAVAALPERERRIVADRHLNEGKPLLSQLGRDFGVSKERVRQLEKRALEKLRTLIRDQAGLRADPAPEA